MSDRFRVVRMLRSKKSGSMLAFATVVDTELEIEFRDLRLFDGSKGRFIKSPSKQYETKDGETKYVDFISPVRTKEGVSDTGQAYFDAILAVVSDYYDNAEDEDERPAKKASSFGAKGGRGPTKTGVAGKKLSF